MKVQQISTWYFLASGCFWASLISVHGFLVLTVQEQFKLSPEQVTIPLILLHFAVVAFEVPTGALADSWSRAKTAALGQLIVAISLFSLPFLSSARGHLATAGIAGFSIFFALGWSMFSGALKGLISLYIKENSPDLMQWFVKSNSGWNNGFLLSVTLLYPLLYQINWLFVWFTAGTLALLSFVFSLRLVFFEKWSGSVPIRQSPIANFKVAIKLYQKEPPLLVYSIVAIVVFSFASTFESTMQAHVALLPTREIEVNLTNWLKAFNPTWCAWFLLTLGAFSASRFDIERFYLFKKISKSNLDLCILSLVIFIFVSYALCELIGSNNNLSAVVFPITAFVVGFFTTSIQNHNYTLLQSSITNSKVTSTVLSINSLGQDLCSGIFLSLFFFPLLSRFGYPWFWVTLSCLTFFILFIVHKKFLKQISELDYSE